MLDDDGHSSFIILQFEADRRAFIITINSFGTELTKDDRAKLYPTCGKLNPDGLSALARADDYDQVRTVAEYYQVMLITFHPILHFFGIFFSWCTVFLNIFTQYQFLLIFSFSLLQDYKQCFEGAGTNPGEKTLEDKFFEYEVSFLYFKK